MLPRLGLMGLHTLLYGMAGYTGGMVRRQLDETKAWTQAIFSLGVSLVYLGALQRHGPSVFVGGPADELAQRRRAADECGRRSFSLLDFAAMV